MATFKIVKKSVQWVGKMDCDSTLAEHVKIETQQLQVILKVEVTLSPGDDAHYLGFIQICTANDQLLDYGFGRSVKFEFPSLPLSDSGDPSYRPWYNTGYDAYIPYWSRALAAPEQVSFASPIAAYNGLGKVGMSDHLMVKAEKKIESLKLPNHVDHLRRIRRDQSFRVWFAAVPVKFEKLREKYTPLFQLDWRYELDVKIKFFRGLQLCAVERDSPSSAEKSGAEMSPIPEEALTAPTCNADQKLVSYYDGAQSSSTNLAVRSQYGMTTLD